LPGESTGVLGFGLEPRQRILGKAAKAHFDACERREAMIYVQINGFYNSCTGLSLVGSGSVPYGFTPPDSKKMDSSALAGSSPARRKPTAR